MNGEVLLNRGGYEIEKREHSDYCAEHVIVDD